MPTRRTRAASRAAGLSRADRQPVVVGGRQSAVGPGLVTRAVRTVLDGERRQLPVSVSFIGPDRMRRLNAEWKGHQRPTDVLAFTLAGPQGDLIGDIYICPAVARDQAKSLDISVREELLRLVIHGTLHVLGYDHPAGSRRNRSVMWRKQERYLACVD